MDEMSSVLGTTQCLTVWFFFPKMWNMKINYHEFFCLFSFEALENVLWKMTFNILCTVYDNFTARRKKNEKHFIRITANVKPQKPLFMRIIFITLAWKALSTARRARHSYGNPKKKKKEENIALLKLQKTENPETKHTQAHWLPGITFVKRNRRSNRIAFWRNSHLIWNQIYGYYAWDHHSESNKFWIAIVQPNLLGFAIFLLLRNGDCELSIETECR